MQWLYYIRRFKSKEVRKGLFIWETIWKYTQVSKLQVIKIDATYINVFTEMPGQNQGKESKKCNNKKHDLEDSAKGAL